MYALTRYLWNRARPRRRGRGDPFAPRGPQGLARGPSRGQPGVRRRVRRRWWLLVPFLLLIAPPLLDLATGHRTHREGPGQAACRLLSVVDGNTLLLRCVDPAARAQSLSLASVVAMPQPALPVPASGGVVAVDLLGVAGPPVLGARCLTEAWAGFRARTALRLRVWLAGELDFVLRPGPPGRAAVGLLLADGRQVNPDLRRAAAACPA